MIGSQAMLQIAVAASLAMLGGAVLMLHQSNRDNRIQARIDQVSSGRVSGAVAKAPSALRDALRMVAGLGRGVLRSGVVSSQTVDSLQRSLEGAGIPSVSAGSGFVASKIIPMMG